MKVYISLLKFIRKVTVGVTGKPSPGTLIKYVVLSHFVFILTQGISKVSQGHYVYKHYAMRFRDVAKP